MITNSYDHMGQETWCSGYKDRGNGMYRVAMSLSKLFKKWFIFNLDLIICGGWDRPIIGKQFHNLGRR